MGVRRERIAAHSQSKMFQRRLDLLPLLQDQSQAVVGGGVARIEAKSVPVLLGSLLRTALLPQHLPQAEAGGRQLRIGLQGASQGSFGLIQVPRLHLHQGQLKVGLRAGPLPLGQGQLESVHPAGKMDR